MNVIGAVFDAGGCVLIDINSLKACLCSVAQQSKEWDSFQLMCKNLKSRHDIDDEKELSDMWEKLDNCLLTTGMCDDICWYLRCRGGQQHNTICGFVAEWQASKGSAAVDISHERYIASSVSA